MATKPEKTRRVVARNRRAAHDFILLERLEAGLVLTGTEVKSLRNAEATLVGAYVRVDDPRMAAWLIGCQIPVYKHGGYANHDPKRKRKMLLHKHQIIKLRQTLKTGGTTVVPLELFFDGQYAKLAIAVARGKDKGDKRESIKARDAKRDMDRAARGRR